MLNKRNLIIIGTIVGGIGGFLYWKFFGCTDGTCPLRSNWMIMTGYGILFGYFLVSLIPVKKKKTEN
jgi:hypothetical protein